MLTVLDLARLATLLAPLFAAISSALPPLAAGDAGHAAAFRSRRISASLSAAALAALLGAGIANDRSLDLLRGSDPSLSGRIAALVAAPGVICLALALLCIVPGRSSATLWPHLPGAVQPTLATILGAAAVWPTDPFERSVALVERTTVAAPTQVGACLLAVGVAGILSVYALQPLRRAHQPLAPIRPPRAASLAALERAVAQARAAPTDPAGAAPIASTPGNDRAQCRRCSEALKEDAVFCSGCGEPVAPSQPAEGHACPTCGAPHGARDRFCARCGMDLSSRALVERP